jgi:hypothetical protein
MIEVIDYLHDKGFRTYMVTGGGQEFVRECAEEVYGVPLEQVVGLSIETKCEMTDAGPVLMRQPKPFFIDDGPGQAIGINLFIGARPKIAFGNSNSDREMLERTTAGDGERLGLLVLHHDAEREFAYGTANGLPATSIGTLRQSPMDEAKARGRVVKSMKEDWKAMSGDRGVSLGALPLRNRRPVRGERNQSTVTKPTDFVGPKES